MNKKILVLLIPLTSWAASETQEERNLREERHMKMLAEIGLPLPDSGIKLVPRSMLGLPQEVIDQGLKDEESLKINGYIFENTIRPMELINFRTHALAQFKQYANITNVTSTHIRPNIQDLKLGFAFKGLPNELGIKTIGFVPQGGFHEESGGWSGVVQFFDKKDIGTCAYAIRNVKVSHTAAQLALEDVTYDINNKATLKSIRGNKNSGFIYKVEWYDNQNFHELECANMKYLGDTTNSVISLANQIDTY
jgi:hypothetical protein